MKEQFRSSYVWRIALVAAMGGLLFGYDWVVIGGAKPFYEPYFKITGDSNSWYSSWAMSSALVGCLIGAVISGFLTDRLGRKKILISAAVLFTASAIWTAMSSQFTPFILARILGGLGIGLASNVSPMYIAEVAPSEYRGGLVSVNQLAIVIGVLAAQLTNLAIYNYSPMAANLSPNEIVESWNGQIGWRMMFAAEVVPALAFLVLAFIIPESPRWLASKARQNESQEILKRIGGPEYAESELKTIADSLTAENDISLSNLFSSSRAKQLLAFGLFIAAFQQWCGINVIFNYAEEIFLAAGYDVSGLMLNIVITGVVNLVFTVVAIRSVDRWGRRPLMLFGALGLSFCYAAIGACYFYQLQGLFVLVFVLVAIAIYAMTLAPITWVLLSEVFPNQMRAAAMGMSVSTLWIACFLLTVSFKPINAALGPAGTFWLYGVICFLGLLVFLRVMPETKGKSLEQIENELMNYE